MEPSLSNPIFGLFLIGLFSSLHCLGMCGGIIGALSFGLPENIRQQRWHLLPYITAYNLGRIGSYALAGALAGGLGQELFQLLSPQYAHVVLQALGSSIMIGIGLYLAGWFPSFAYIERLGRPLWARIEPYAKKQLPVRSPMQALLLGLLWGWLPCGLVYSTLIVTTSSGGAIKGASFMFAFGLGTLPAVMATGMLSGWIKQITRMPWIRAGVGLTLIIMAIISFFLTIQHSTTLNGTHIH